MASLVPSTLTALVALVPLYATLGELRRILRPEVYAKVVRSPLLLGALAFGTAHAATGNTRATLAACTLAYAVVLARPDVAAAIFDPATAQEQLGVAPPEE